MTLITGTFKDSGQTPLASGVLRVQLNAPLPDSETAPDSYLLALPHDFLITNGALEPCNLKESETAQISYTFSLFRSSVDYDFFYAADSTIDPGVYYGRNDERPTHLHTDSRYYTGLTHLAESQPLDRVARQRLEAIGDVFQAIVPNQPNVEFAQLERTGFATDRTPQTARQVAEALRQNPTFMQNLIDFLVIQPYSATTLYRRGNLVSLGGSAYQCLRENTSGLAPATNPLHWRLFAAKGDPGGTGGDNSAFAAAWDGDLNAPSKNVLWDYISASLATKAEVNARVSAVSPALSGNATYETQALGTGAPASSTRTRIATTEYAYNEAIDRYRRALISLMFVASSTNPPQFCVRANGQTLNRTTYAELWAIAQGTTGYGTGNGTTTFTVPNVANPGTGLYWVVWAGV
jgi:hypothetical protein